MTGGNEKEKERNRNEEKDKKIKQRKRKERTENFSDRRRKIRREERRKINYLWLAAPGAVYSLKLTVISASHFTCSLCSFLFGQL